MSQKKLSQCADAVDAWIAHGKNATAAARSLGLARSTFWDRLEAGLEGRDQLLTNNGSKAPQVEKLKQQVEELQKALDVARRPRVQRKLGKHKSSKGDYKRVCIPDTHGSHADEDAISELLADIRELRPREIVMLGDHLDCGGFLAQHHAMGYVAETDYTFEQDVGCANQFLDDLQKAAPGAVIHYLEGNHERRIERWIVTQVLRNGPDARMLQRMFSVRGCLSLEKRGIHHYEQGKFYQSLSVPSTIRLGKCFFTHGHRTGQHAASQMLRDVGGNVVFGHTHRSDSYVMRNLVSGIIGSWCPGCLCKLQPMWSHTAPTMWSHGYHLQLCRSNDEFLPINVPIIGGRSFLVPLLRTK